MSQLKAVIFDVDGVLVDTERLVSRAATRLFKELGVEASPKEFEAHVGSGPERYLMIPAKQHGLELDLKEAVKRLDALFIEEVDEGIPRYPGAIALLALCREQGLMRAVATSAHREKLDRTLESLGLNPGSFDAVVSCEEVSQNKPAGDIYLACARKLGVDPGECLVVEDSIHGIAAARDAGMSCVAVANSFGELALRQANRVYASTLKLAQELQGKRWSHLFDSLLLG